MGRGYSDHWISDDIVKKKKVCKGCGKTYTQIYEEQMPGFRQVSYDECPYCGHVHGRSMSYDYMNKTLEDYKEIPA